MPLGKYKDFNACVIGKTKEGLSKKAAQRYCGALQKKIEGSKEYEYGLCPICYAEGVDRERSLDGKTTCDEGHRYAHARSILLDEETTRAKLRNFFEENSN